MEIKKDKQKTLMTAIERRDKAGIDAALLAGADINDVETEPHKWSPLSTVAQCCSNTADGLDIAKYLMMKGASPDSRDRRGRTPLFFAVKTNSTMMLTEMAKYSKDTDTSDGNGVGAIQMAVYKGNNENIKILLGMGAREKDAHAVAGGTEHHHTRRLLADMKSAPASKSTYGTYSSTSGATEL